MLYLGMRGYALQQCLKERRKQQEAEQGSSGEQEQLKYEQPGELVTLPSGKYGSQVVLTEDKL